MNSSQLVQPSPWVRRFAHVVREGGVVLDVACGAGRHARFFKDLGFQVVAVDRDPECLARLDVDETHLADLELGGWPFGHRRFDAIVVTNYLHRPLFADLTAALDENAVLIYETFAQGNAALGRPARPEFLLEHGELLMRTRGLHVLAYEEGFISDPKPAFIERICAVRSSNPEGDLRHRL